MFIFIQLWLKSISYLIDQYRAYFHSVVTKIDQLLCDWSVMIWDAASTLGFCLSAAASNAGQQIWMKIIYIILHSLNSICKTSLVDMKLLFQLCSNDGLPLEGIWRLLWSITLADTSRDCHFLFFLQCYMYPDLSSWLSSNIWKRRSYFVTLWWLTRLSHLWPRVYAELRSNFFVFRF